MFMKKKLFGMVSVIFLIGFMFNGCMSTPYVRGDSDLNGTWSISVAEGEMTHKYNNGLWEEALNGLLTRRGHYTTNNGNIYLDIKEIHGRYPTLQKAGLASRWYSVSELFYEYGATFENATLTYSIEGDQLSLLSSLGSGSPTIWIRKN